MSEDLRPFTPEEAVRFITAGSAINEYLDESDEIARLLLPKDSADAQACKSIVRLIVDYSHYSPPLGADGALVDEAAPYPERPLSIAIFGPPGSGKTRMAKQLRDAATKNAEFKGEFDKDQHYLKLNVTEYPSFNDLAARLETFLEDVGDGMLRYVFIDEFDAVLDDTPIGWLKYFLVPMQDGTISYKPDPADGGAAEDGDPVREFPVGRTVFMFAGGTADSFDEFPESHEAHFRLNKGPDFVSRLRGYLNIEGINGDQKYRTLRRAQVLKYQLSQRAPSLQKKDVDGLQVADEVLLALLKADFYKHGARSMQAILDMSNISNADQFTPRLLPDKALAKLHVSRGDLDGTRVGISANDQDQNAAQAFHVIAEALLNQGATLVYGGDMLSGDLLQLVDELAKRPGDLLASKKTLLRNYRAFPALGDLDDERQRIEGIDWIQMADSLTDIEKKALNLPEHPAAITPHPIEVNGEMNRPGEYLSNHHLAWALSLFRMRFRMARDCHALIAMGGNTSEGWGRFPGVVEEVMLALAFGCPVYLLGHVAGTDTVIAGAARELGHLFNLSDTPGALPAMLEEPADYSDSGFKQLLEGWSDKFEIPSKPGLPKTYDTLTKFLLEKWATHDNGLTDEDNRELFNCADPEECANLITRGLKRLSRRENRT